MIATARANKLVQRDVLALVGVDLGEQVADVLLAELVRVAAGVVALVQDLEYGADDLLELVVVDAAIGVNVVQLEDPLELLLVVLVCRGQVN